MDTTREEAPNDIASTMIVEHLMIFDTDSKEVFVNQRGSRAPSIAPENQENVIERTDPPLD